MRNRAPAGYASISKNAESGASVHAIVIGCIVDGSRRNYDMKFEGDFCCKTMDEVRKSGIFLSHLTIAAKRLTGEELREMRFCPWCGWDNDKIAGYTKHRKKFEDDEEADHIGASR